MDIINSFLEHTQKKLVKLDILHAKFNIFILHILGIEVFCGFIEIFLQIMDIVFHVWMRKEMG